MGLRFDKTSFGRQNSYPTSPGEFRGKGNKQIKVTKSVDLTYGVKVPDAIKILQDASKGLLDAELDIEQDQSYGDSYITCTVSGWRDATKQEIQDKRDFDAWHKTNQEQIRKERDEAEIVRLRKERPELFK